MIQSRALSNLFPKTPLVFARLSTILALLSGFLLASPAIAIVVTSYLETDKQNVGSAWQTWSFSNSYTNAVPVCTYVLPSNNDEPTAIRIRNIGAASMQIRLQDPRDNPGITPSDVHCIIAEAGAHTLPDGTEFEAHTVVSDRTSGRVLGWSIANTEDVSSSIVHTYTNPVVLGQVISHNDSNFSLFYSHSCDRRRNPAFEPGVGDGICVGKHISKDNGVTNRADETLGYIVVESGSGTVNGVKFQTALGANSIRGVPNGAPFSYSLNDTYTEGVATQAAENGGDGGWAVMYGLDPLVGNQIDLAIDEDNMTSGRAHTTEQVGFWVFKKVTTITLEKLVVNDDGGTAVDTDFTLTFDNGSGNSGTGVEGDTDITQATIPAGTFTLSESAISGYTLTAINCDGADSNGLDGVIISVNEHVICVLVNDDLGVDIEVIKTASDESPNIGETVTFTLEVKNNGPDVATNVSVSDVVTSGFSYVPSSISGGASNNDTDPSGSGLSWSIATLNAGASSFVSFQAIVLAP